MRYTDRQTKVSGKSRRNAGGAGPPGLLCFGVLNGGDFCRSGSVVPVSTCSEGMARWDGDETKHASLVRGWGSKSAHSRLRRRGHDAVAVLLMMAMVFGDGEDPKVAAEGGLTD